MNSIFNEFNRCLREHPDQLLYVYLDKQGKIKESYSYQEFDEKTCVLAHYLQEKHQLNKRQPDVQRNLRRFTHGSDEEQDADQRDGRDRPGIA